MVISRLFSFLRESWWVVAILLVTYMMHVNASQNTMRLYRELTSSLNHLTEEKNRALELQNTLKLKIASESDPEWIALMLMKGLGVVPSDQMKVRFEE